MATQKNDGGGTQAMTTPRTHGGRDSSLARRRSSGRQLSRGVQSSPFALMRRMFDDLDVNPYAGMMGSPVSMMRRMFNDMERMFESSDLAEQGELGDLGLDWIPRIDVRRRDDRLVIRADLPGISPDQVRIHAQDDSIVIEGEREEVRDDRNEDTWQSERIYGRFRRVIPLPDGAQPENAQARFENGVLEVMLPVSETHSRGRRIEIQGASGSTEQRQIVRNQAADAGQGQQQQQRPTERH
jgi:HSP20 family protein